MIKIDDEFKNLIDPLTKEERELLEASCISEGIREKIIVWHETIIDGHNRYDIAQKNNLSYETMQKEFESRDEVVKWIINNQLGKRNITEEQKSYLRGKRYEAEKKNIGGTGANQYKEQSYQNDNSAKTAELLAKEYNVGTATIIRDEQFAKGVDIIAKIKPEEKTEILHGTSELTKQNVQEIARAVKTVEKEVKQNTVMKTEEEIQQEINAKAKQQAELMLKQIEEEKERKKQEKQKQIEEKREKIKTQDPEKFNSEFDVIYADCPWRYDFVETENRAIENQYPTMDLEEIKNIKIPCSENSVLLLWATAPKLIEAIEVMKAWGFQYKTQSIWDKEIIGMGYWFRGQHEILLVGTKGKFSPPTSENRVSSVYKEKRTQHSKKPSFYYELIEKMFPNMRYLEMFSRKKYNEKWQVWGNQANE